MKNRVAIYGLLVGGLLLAGLATVIAFTKIQDQIESSYSSTHPDLALLVYQIQSDIQSVQVAMSGYQFGDKADADFSDVELAFDILWSLAYHAHEGIVGSRFLALPGAARYLEDLRTEIADIEPLLPNLRQRQFDAYQVVQDSFTKFGSVLNPLHLAAARANDAYQDAVTNRLLSILVWIFALLFALVLIGAAAGALIARDRVLQSRIQATLKRRVQARTRELALRNSDLEAANVRLREFAQAASHDLQEPLRKIKLFSSDLVKQIGPDLTNEQDMAVLAISSSAERLQMSLQNLLTLGRVSHRPLEYEALDLGEVVADTLEYLEEAVRASDAKIAVGRMPTISADNVQMRQLFRSLIGNALKFRAADRECRVEISFKQPSGSRAGQIEISDNGIGFPTEQGLRIFEPFRQLYSRTRYDGAGLGLAIAARIADMHGWQVTATGTPDKGATFTIYFAEDALQDSRDIKAA